MPHFQPIAYHLFDSMSLYNNESLSVWGGGGGWVVGESVEITEIVVFESISDTKTKSFPIILVMGGKKERLSESFYIYFISRLSDNNGLLSFSRHFCQEK
jgi:hypothetical protein